MLQVLGVEAVKDGVLHFPRLNLVPGTKAASVAHRPETGLLGVVLTNPPWKGTPEGEPLPSTGGGVRTVDYALLTAVPGPSWWEEISSSASFPCC